MPDDAPVVLVADHVAGLREAIDWCETHPAFAAMLTHTTVSAHIDDPVMFAAALRQFDAAAERRETETQAMARIMFCNATQLRVTVPLSRLPLVPTGESRPVMARAWPK